MHATSSISARLETQRFSIKAVVPRAWPIDSAGRGLQCRPCLLLRTAGSAAPAVGRRRCCLLSGEATGRATDEAGPLPLPVCSAAFSRLLDEPPTRPGCFPCRSVSGHLPHAVTPAEAERIDRRASTKCTHVARRTRLPGPVRPIHILNICSR